MSGTSQATNSSADPCFYFAGFVLIITTVWVYVLRTRSFAFLAYAMFFPGVTALVYSAADGNFVGYWQKILGFQKPLHSVIFSGLAVALVYTLVEACAWLSVTAGWAKPAKFQKVGIHEHNRSRVGGFLRAAGEEVGWRCFLLPCLLEHYSATNALLISGIVWGLFHVPVMILLTYQLRPERPLVTVAVQFLSCVLSAFPHGWLANKTGYSLWACSVMHWFWNIYNPTILGSIYTNTPGRYTGQQWLINGEGLAGCIVLLPLTAAILLELRYSMI